MNTKFDQEVRESEGIDPALIGIDPTEVLEPYITPRIPPDGSLVRMSAEAFYGPLGRLAQGFKGRSEGCPEAIYLQLIVAYGSLLGREHVFPRGAGKEVTKSFVIIVGETATRKETSWDAAYYVLQRLTRGGAEEWRKHHIHSGVASGEALTNLVRDPRQDTHVNRKGEAETVVVAGVVDKRLMVVEKEFGSTLIRGNWKGSTLSTCIRKAYDSDGKLENNVVNSESKASTQSSHISYIGHITPTELQLLLSEQDRHNGFANRFLFGTTYVDKRLVDPEELPLNGCPDDLREDIAILDSGLRWTDPGQTGGALVIYRFSPEAKEVWAAFYGSDEKYRGELQAMTSRRATQATRIAMTLCAADAGIEPLKQDRTQQKQEAEARDRQVETETETDALVRTFTDPTLSGIPTPPEPEPETGPRFQIDDAGWPVYADDADPEEPESESEEPVEPEPETGPDGMDLDRLLNPTREDIAAQKARMKTWNALEGKNGVQVVGWAKRQQAKHRKEQRLAVEAAVRTPEPEIGSELLKPVEATFQERLITAAQLRAAIAVVEYSERAVTHFLRSETGDRLMDKILVEVRKKKGGRIERGSLHVALGGKVDADRLERALCHLADGGFIQRWKTTPGKKGGRPMEIISLPTEGG